MLSLFMMVSFDLMETYISFPNRNQYCQDRTGKKVLHLFLRALSGLLVLCAVEKELDSFLIGNRWLFGIVSCQRFIQSVMA